MVRVAERRRAVVFLHRPVLDLEAGQVVSDSIRREAGHLRVGRGLVVVSEEHRRESRPGREGRDYPLPRRVECVRGEERQAQAGIYEIAGRHPNRGQILDANLEPVPKVRLDGGLERGPGGGLPVHGQDAPAGPEQFPRVAPGPAAEVDGEAKGVRDGFSTGRRGRGLVLLAEPLDRHSDGLPGRPLDRDFVVFGPVIGVVGHASSLDEGGRGVSDGAAGVAAGVGRGGGPEQDAARRAHLRQRHQGDSHRIDAA